MSCSFRSVPRFSYIINDDTLPAFYPRFYRRGGRETPGKGCARKPFNIYISM